MRKWDELPLKVKLRRYQINHHSVPPNWKPPVGEERKRIRFQENSPEQQQRLIAACSKKVPAEILNPIKFYECSATVKRQLWWARNPCVPKDWIPPRITPWDQLSIESKRRAYQTNDPRVPDSWDPITETEIIPIPEELTNLDGPELLLALKRYVESNT